MKTIDYKEGMKLVLMVRDTGGFDGFAVYLNGHLSFPPVLDQEKRRFDVTRPSSDEAVVIRFGGNDGGKSAIFDIADGKRELIEQQDGLTHAYLLRAA